jgi:hypothetical protein
MVHRSGRHLTKQAVNLHLIAVLAPLSDALGFHSEFPRPLVSAHRRHCGSPNHLFLIAPLVIRQGRGRLGPTVVVAWRNLLSCRRVCLRQEPRGSLHVAAESDQASFGRSLLPRHMFSSGKGAAGVNRPELPVPAPPGAKPGGA